MSLEDGIPYPTNGLLKMTLLPALQVVNLGARKNNLDMGDLWRLRKAEAAQVAWKQFLPHWERQLRATDPSLITALFRSFAGPLTVCLLLLLISFASQFALPVLMPHIVRWFTYHEDLPLWWIYVYTAAIFSSFCMGSFMLSHSQLLGHSIGIRVRAVLVSLIFSKTLTTPASRHHASVYNLVAADASIIMKTINVTILGLLAPIHILATIGVLGIYITYFCLIPLAFACLILPITFLLGRSINHVVAKHQQAADTRIKYVKEFLNIVNILKYYAWERPFLDNIHHLRDAELRRMRNYYLIRAFMLVTGQNIQGIGTGLCFFFYGLLHDLTLEITFTVFAYLFMLKRPFAAIPHTIIWMEQYSIALRRILFFALSADLDDQVIRPKKDVSQGPPPNPGSTEKTPRATSQARPSKKLRLRLDDLHDPDVAMEITDGSFSWETHQSIAESQYLEWEALVASSKATIATSSSGKDLLEAEAQLKIAHEARDKLELYVAKMRKKTRRVKRSTYLLQRRLTQSTPPGSAIISPNSEADPGQVTRRASFQDSVSTEYDDSPDPVISWKDMQVKGVDVEGLVHEPAVVLKHVNVTLHTGSMTLVVGAVGSGKSTLANAFCGEVNVVSGEVRVNAEIAYAPQEPWIFTGTIRENICFGLKFRKAWYQQVIEACCLTTDIAGFVAGDLTEIGEKGANLSGGQRARLGLARALYTKRPIMILDDPFGALDSHVAEYMFENVIGLMRNMNCTILLVCNQLQWLNQADLILVMKHGRIVEHGSFDDLITNGPSDGVLSALLATQSINDDGEDPVLEIADITAPIRSPSGGSLGHHGSLRRSSIAGHLSLVPVEDPSTDGEGADSDRTVTTTTSGMTAPGLRPPSTKLGIYPKNDAERKKLGRLVQEEGKDGEASWFATYWAYAKAGGILVTLIMILVRAMRMTAQVTNGLWLSWWATGRFGMTRTEYLAGYLSLAGAEMVGQLITELSLVWWCVSASRYFHKAMIKSVSKAPLSWFNETPLGRILTRFTSDIWLIDRTLPYSLETVLTSSFAFLATIASVSTGSPYVLIGNGVAVIVFALITMHFRKAAIELQRLEATTRAPINTHMIEAQSGIAVIRIYGRSKAYKLANFNVLNQNAVAFYASRLASTWFIMTLGMLGNVLIAATFVTIILVRTYIPETIALAYMINALANTGNFSFALGSISTAIIDVEGEMTSIERALAYAKKIPHEAIEARASAPPAPDASWPSEGKVEFNNLVVAYRSDRPVLKGLTCTFKAGEKIGVVGRSGAGKSTLAAALFRILEPANGTILVDGVSIADLSLEQLRSKMALIPQTPLLFEGTIRHNLDPFSAHTDDEIWNALSNVKLSERVAGLQGKLLAKVQEGGLNFSVGERQLLAMARCLLRDTKIVILDEATAAIDIGADALVQKMIRRNFHNKTVIAIAHRLNTVMDFDRILVLDGGRLAEFDTPANLLARKGILAAMVTATGPQTAALLKSIASGQTKLYSDASDAGAHEVKEVVPTKDQRLAKFGRLLSRHRLTVTSMALTVSPSMIHHPDEEDDSEVPAKKA